MSLINGILSDIYLILLCTQIALKWNDKMSFFFVDIPHNECRDRLKLLRTQSETLQLYFYCSL